MYNLIWIYQGIFLINMQTRLRTLEFRSQCTCWSFLTLVTTILGNTSLSDIYVGHSAVNFLDFSFIWGHGTHEYQVKFILNNYLLWKRYTFWPFWPFLWMFQALERQGMLGSRSLRTQIQLSSNSLPSSGIPSTINFSLCVFIGEYLFY